MTPTGSASADTSAAVHTGAHAGGILRYLTVAGLVFLAVVMALKPDVGFSAPPAARLAFWAAQIGVGLFVLQSILYLLTRAMGASRVPNWALVVLSGLLGAVVLAPVYWLIGEGVMQQWLGYPDLPDDDGVDPVASTVGMLVVGEYFDIVLPVTTAWSMICLPRLHWLVPPLLLAQAREAVPAERAAGGGATGDANPDVVLPDPGPPYTLVLCADQGDAGAPGAPGDQGDQGDATTRLTATAESAGEDPTTASAPVGRRSSWRTRLPIEIGDDVIAVASELQYLRVWTPRGCVLVLGSLADVEAEDGASGLRVHRSWWVASKHVARVRRTSTGVVCLMSNGRQVPVSRRRRAEVLARFGDGARYLVPPSSEAVA